MQGYDQDDLFAEGIKSKSWRNKFFKKSQTIYYNSKKKKNKINCERSKKFFPPKNLKDIDEDERKL